MYPVHYSERHLNPCFLHSLLCCIFFAAPPEKRIFKTKPKERKNEREKSFPPFVSLLLAMPPETLLPLSLLFFFFFCAGNKVTTLSKGCLIRQSAAVAGPRGCCQARLCTTASAGEIYPVCFGTVANMFPFLSRYAPSLPRKKNIFAGGEEEKALRQEPVSWKDFLFLFFFLLAGST